MLLVTILTFKTALLGMSLRHHAAGLHHVYTHYWLPWSHSQGKILICILHKGVQRGLGEEGLDDVSTLLPNQVVAKPAGPKLNLKISFEILFCWVSRFKLS